MLTQLLTRRRPQQAAGPSCAAEHPAVASAPRDQPFATVARETALRGKKGGAQQELERRHNQSGE